MVSEMDISGGELSFARNAAMTVEDSGIHSSVAGILKNFRMNFGAEDLRSIALGFKVITYKKLISLYESDPSQQDLISNWVLECKFWTILESLLDVKFNRNVSSLIKNSGNGDGIDLQNISEYSSETVLNDQIINSSQ